MLRPLIPLLLSTALALVGGDPASAEEFLENIEFSGLLEMELAIGTSAGGIQKAEFVLTPEVAVDLTPSVRLTVIGRLRGDIADDLEPGRPRQRNHAAMSERLLAGDHVDGALRAFYIDAEIGGTFLRVGKQQVVWGQADGLKVLDILNPQSFREFILDDFEDSRIPLWMVNTEIPIGDAFLQLLWIPDRTYDDIPEAGAAFAFTSPLIVPAAPQGVPVTVAPLHRPGDFLGDSDVGVKLSAFLGGWDLSLNYAYHYFDRPVVRREITPAGVDVDQNYERTHLVGGTFSNVFGDFTLRGEAGYSSGRYFLTDDATDADGVIHSGELSYVLGLDYQGWRDWIISAQVFQSIVTSPAAGLVRDTVNSTATLLLRRDLMNDALTLEALLIQSLNQGDGLLQASVEYEWRTDVRLRIGADIFYGKLQGLFGQFDASDRLTAGVAIGF